MKNSQGNKKLKQYLEDLRKNEDFQQHVKDFRQVKTQAERETQLLKLCEDFGVDWELFQYMRENSGDGGENWAKDAEMCVVGYDFDETFAGIEVKNKLEKKLHKKAFPVSIDLHKFATKRDVLDYIGKNWKMIEAHLNYFRDGRKIIKQRNNEKRNEFIWKNKNLKTEKIKELLDKNFPKNGLVYNNIYDIIREERKRRTQRLA